MVEGAIIGYASKWWLDFKLLTTIFKNFDVLLKAYIVMINASMM